MAKFLNARALLKMPPGCFTASAVMATFCIQMLAAPLVETMRVDPERIAARLRIEQEIEMDKLLSRNRRQLVTPKEISISITAPLFSSRLFEYGSDVGDQELPRSLDVGKKITLTYPLSFYGQEHSHIFILSNGAIGFDSATRSYRANVLPSNVKLIAPFWNRNDLRNGGHVHYREVTSGRVLERGQSEIRYQYDVSVKVKSCVLVTWEKMQPLGAAPLPDDNTNTFQAAIFITDNGTFANFIYKNIGWTQGAEAGFSKGDGTEHFALPTSGTGNIMYLEEYGNTGIPGEWMFVLGQQRVERCKAGIKGDTCDEECLPGEWGADCASCCHCASGSCNAISGDCSNGLCAECWLGPPTCQIKKNQCRAASTAQCAHNAISFTDYDRCGEPIQRCQCLTGYEGDGHIKCVDVDECAQPGTCHENAICTNTPGRYFCQCNEGFSGDGISECIASFLYPFQGHQTLPRNKNAKVSWKLKYPLVIFGQPRDRLTISTHGLIALEDVSRIKAGDRLDTMHIHGIAPFFAPIDVSKGGQVFVDETTDSDVLTRATQTVTDNFYDNSFVASSVVLVSFINVTGGSKKLGGNTFQTLLIGGTNKLHENLTFVQMLYKDLPWSDGAEAGIMALDDANSILLPGSGTEGIEQLSQLSNIRTPGQWLYRIDSEVVYPCMQPNLQPPYCDADSPTLINQQIPSAPTTMQARPHHKSPVQGKEQRPHSALRPSQTAHSTDVIEVPGPRIIQPVLVEPSPPRQKLKPSSALNTEIFAHTSQSSAGTSKPRPVFLPSASTPHIPIVSIDSVDIDNLPPDVFETATFPPFVTVVPQLFTPKSPANNSPSTPVLGTPSVSEVNLETVDLRPSLQAESPTQSTPARETAKTTEIDSTKESSESLPSEPKMKPVDIDFGSDGTVVEVNPTELAVAKPVVPTKATTEEEIPTKETDVELTIQNAEEANSSNVAVVVFTTSPKNKAMPTKPALVTARGPSTSAPSGPYDNHHDAKVESATSNLAVIIPTAIIAVWLLLLGVIALFCCCRKKRAERQFRELYFPTHQIRPLATNYAVRKSSKHFDGSYEDHLEKAARLSSELSSYNQRYAFNGRY